MQDFPKNKALILIIIAITVLAIGSGLAIITNRTLIHNVGTIETFGVGVYQDKNCTNALTSFDWGMIEPGSVKNDTVYIRNEGNGEANLYLETTNWNPSNASNYITLSWNYANQTLKPNEAIQVTFTLSTSPNIIGMTNFNFDIIIGSS
jgi:hypothetical protein